LYVDNTDIVVLNNRSELEEEEVVARAQLLLDKWQYALYITGSKLKYSKCY